MIHMSLLCKVHMSMLLPSSVAAQVLVSLQSMVFVPGGWQLLTLS
jgi:hypothetical protein